MAKNNDFVFKKEEDKKLLIYLIEYFGDGDLSDITDECIEALMCRMSEIKRIKNSKECFFSNPIGELHFKEYSPSKNYEHK